MRLFYVAVLTFFVFVADLASPLGVAAGVPYILPVAASSSLKKRSASPHPAFVVASVSTVLLGLGLVLAPDGGIPWWVVVVNRSLSLLAIWVLAVSIRFRFEPLVVVTFARGR